MNLVITFLRSGLQLPPTRPTSSILSQSQPKNSSICSTAISCATNMMSSSWPSCKLRSKKQPEVLILNWIMVRRCLQSQKRKTLPKRKAGACQLIKPTTSIKAQYSHLFQELCHKSLFHHDFQTVKPVTVIKASKKRTCRSKLSINTH